MKITFGSFAKDVVLVFLLVTTAFLASAYSILYSSISVPSQGSIDYGVHAPKWAVIGPLDEIPALNNLFLLFDNQGIEYDHLDPSQLTNYGTIGDYSGLVTWTNINNPYNFSAVRLFAATRPVVSHVFDFCYDLYPSLRTSMQNTYTRFVTYMMDWGNFRNGDKAEMNNGTNYLTTVSASDLAGFQNITVIAKADQDSLALFQMRGSNANAGFYVMDLYATRSNSYLSGIYHILPAISVTASIGIGRYGRWLTDGISWRSIDWVYSWMNGFATENSDVVKLRRIGTSVEGRAINALFIGKGTRYFIADGAIHGNEKSGTHALVRFAELIVEWYRSSASWQQKLNQYTIILVPTINPDGYVANTRENANGKDLNHQFPPGTTTTEPEAWALRWLMGNYTPTLYVNIHADGPDYPQYVFYAGYTVEPYRTYARWALQQGNLSFVGLGHWGTVYSNVSISSYRSIAPSGFDDMPNEYAAYTYKAIGVLTEHFSENKPESNIEAQDYYITVMLGILLHHDRANGFMLHSNAFISKVTYNNFTSLNVSIDTEYIALGNSSETRILDFKGRGKPDLVYIDNVLKSEGSGWSWSGSSNTTTVKNAEQSILLNWV